MTIPSEPRTPRLYHASGTSAGAAFAPATAMAIASVALGSYLLASIVAINAGAPFLAALVVGQVMLLVVPLAALRRARSPVAVLGLRRAAPRFYLAATLIGCSLWYLNVRLVDLLPLPTSGTDALVDVVRQPPLLLTLIVLCVVPAVCEEVLFRGAVLRSLATRFVPAVAIVLMALLFASYHLSLLQLVPTFSLGLVLGVVAHRAGSVLPTMLAHCLNNVLAVTMTRRVAPGLGWIEHYPAATLGIAALLTGCGLALATREPGVPT